MAVRLTLAALVCALCALGHGADAVGQPVPADAVDGGSGVIADGFDGFEEALRFAENSFIYGDYLDVVQVLEPRLLPAAPAGVEDTVLIRAYTLLGTAAHFETLDEVAESAFLELLLRDPRFRLDPLLYPPRVIERFEGVREANSERLDALLAEDEPGAVVYVEREVTEQSLFVSILPFGYGFFASDRDVAGMSYAIAEAGFGAAMIGLFLTNELARGDDGYFDDAERARNRGRAQIAMASAFSATVLANIIHGAVTHDRTRRVDFRTLTEPPPELSDDRSRSRSRGWRFSFAPLLDLR